MTILKQVPISHYPDKQGKQTASPLNAVTWTKDMNSTLDEHFYPFCFSLLDVKMAEGNIITESHKTV